MSKICPNCKYPNPDNADECFKCKADISEAAIRERQVRERLERERVRQERNNQRTSQRFQERLQNMEREEMEKSRLIVSQNNECFAKAVSAIKNSIGWFWVIFIFLCLLGIFYYLYPIFAGEENFYHYYACICFGSAVSFGVLISIFKWMLCSIVAQQKTISLLEKIIENENNE